MFLLLLLPSFLLFLDLSLLAFSSSFVGCFPLSLTPSCYSPFVSFFSIFFIFQFLYIFSPLSSLFSSPALHYSFLFPSSLLPSSSHSPFFPSLLLAFHHLPVQITHTRFHSSLSSSFLFFLSPCPLLHPSTAPILLSFLSPPLSLSSPSRTEDRSRSP